MTQARSSFDPVRLWVVASYAVLGALIAHHKEIATFQPLLDYARQAQAIASHGLSGYDDPFHPIGYALLLGMVGKLTGNLYVAGQLLSLVAGAAALWLVGDLTERTFDRTVARRAVLLAPIVTIFGLTALTAETMMLSVALELGVLSAVNRRNARTLTLAGVLGGLAFGRATRAS